MTVIDVDFLKLLWFYYVVTLQVEDLTVELETQKSATSNMDKKQKRFDQLLSDEKAVSQRQVSIIQWNLSKISILF